MNKYRIGDHIYSSAFCMDSHDNLRLKINEFEIIDISEKGEIKVKSTDQYEDWVSKEIDFIFCPSKETAILHALCRFLSSATIERNYFTVKNNRKGAVRFDDGDIVYIAGFDSDEFAPVMHMCAGKVNNITPEDIVVLRSGNKWFDIQPEEKEFCSYTAEDELIRELTHFLGRIQIDFVEYEETQNDSLEKQEK